MARNITILLISALLIFSCATNRDPVTAPEREGYVVKGYLPVWQYWMAEDIVGENMTEIIVSFALVTDGYEGDPGLMDGRKIKDKHFEELQKVRDKYPDLKITVALGGWGADGFSDAVLTEDSRDKFAESIVKYLIKYDFDGIDLDWEFPVNGGWGSIKARPEDRENFSAFLIVLRDKLNKASNKKGEYLTMSVAANVGSDFYNSWTELDVIVETADEIHLMTYDNFGSSSSTTGHHTGAAFTEDAVVRFIEAGCPPEKLVIGGAFYGKLMSGVDFSGGNPVGAPLSDSGNVSDINYTYIVKDYMSDDSYIRGWDSDQVTGRAPYLWSEENGEFITYDDPQSIKEKADIVKKYNLAGAMFWDYTQDWTRELLGVFAKELLE